MTNDKPHILEITTIESVPAIRNLARKEINLPSYIHWYGVAGACLDTVAFQAIGQAMPVFTGILLVAGIFRQEMIREAVYTAVSTKEVNERKEPIQEKFIVNGKPVAKTRPDIELPNGYKLTGRQIDWLVVYAQDNETMSNDDLVNSDFWTTGNTTDRRKWYKSMRNGMIDHDPPLIVMKGNHPKFTDEFYRFIGGV